MSTNDFEGYSLRLADKHGQPRSMLAASLEKASSFLASSPSGRVRLQYSRELLLELSTKKECNVCPVEVPTVLRKDYIGPGAKEDEGILIQRGPRNTPLKGGDGEGRSPQENGPSSWQHERDRDAWRPTGRPRSFEDETAHMGGRGLQRGGPDRERDRWDKERGEKEIGAGPQRGNGPRNFAENHRPMNPPGFGGARWGETRAGPGGRFRPDERDREGYNGPGRFRGDEGGRSAGPGHHGPAGPARPLWDHPSGRDRGPPGAGASRPGPGFDRRGPSDDKRGPPARPTGGSDWDTDNYKDDETFGFDDPKQQTGTEKEEEEKRRRAQFEKEFEAMRQARHKKPEAAEGENTPSKKHDEDGIWDTNLSFEETSTTTTVTAGGQVNRRTVTSTLTGLRAPPGFGGGAFRKGEELAGPVTPRTPRASDGDWRINKRVVTEESVEPAKDKTPAKAAEAGAAGAKEGKRESSGPKTPGGPSLLDTIFASGDKGAKDTKDEEGSAKRGESLVLKNLFKNAHKKVFPGLADDDPVTEAVLSDRWADAVEAEEADAKASKFARWFNKTEEPRPASTPSAEAQKEESVLASSALLSILQKPAAPTHSEAAPPQRGAANPLNLLFPSSTGSAPKAMPAGPSLAEIEQAMQSAAGGQKDNKSSSRANEQGSKLTNDLVEKQRVGGQQEAAPESKPKASKAEPGGVAVKGLRDLVEQEKRKDRKTAPGGALLGPLEDVLNGKPGNGPASDARNKAPDVQVAEQRSGKENNADVPAGGAQADWAADGKALLFGAQKQTPASAPGGVLASIFGAAPGPKPAGVPGKKADAPVFMTLEDIEKSLLEEAGKSGAGEAAKPPPAAAAPNPSEKADVVASMHLLSLLKKGPQTGQPARPMDAGPADAESESKGVGGADSKALTGAAKGGTNGSFLEEGGWSFPEGEGPMSGAATFFGGPVEGSKPEAAEKQEGLRETGRDAGTRPETTREAQFVNGFGEGVQDEPEMVGDLLMRRHLAGHDIGASRFVQLEGQSEAALAEENMHRASRLGAPEGSGWPGGPPGPFYGAPQGQQQAPPGMVPPQAMHHLHQQHQQLPPHLAGLWPYGANGGPFGPGPPSGSFYGADRGPYAGGDRQSQVLERQGSGASNGPSQGGPFGQPQGHAGGMQGPPIPGLLPPYAFNLRGLVPMAGPQGMPPQFAHMNGPLPGAYMRPLFNLPYTPEGLHGGGPPQAMYGPPSSQSGRSGEQQLGRPPPSQFLGGGPYGSDFWGGGQPGGLSSGEGMPSAAR